MVAPVATRSANERPFMTPLWFVADGGILFIATRAESWTSRNVSRHPDIVILFSALLGLRGLSVREYLATLDPAAGTVYYVSLGVFAVMPLL
jgi:Pyridoxamine 5'-phosphate oxidase